MHGGTNRSLLNLLSEINITKYNIELYSINTKGHYHKLFIEYTKIINKIIKIEIEDKNNTTGIRYKLLNGCINLSIKTKDILRKLGIDLVPIYLKYIYYKFFIKNNYDIVIGFQEGGATLLASFFKKCKKIAWIHCEYERYFSGSNIKTEKEIYKLFDSIVCVSEYTKKSFLKINPELSNNTVCINNIINSKNILSLSKEKTSYNSLNSCFTIISIGRIDAVKRFSKIPEICNTLKERGCNFRWYLIGGTQKGHTDEFDILFELVNRYKVSDVFSWLGEVENPYPYILNSDLLVCLSVSEACPNVINEAKILHVPVVSTNFGSASEFVENGVNGLISPIDEISNRIYELISNNIYYNKIKLNINNFYYDNSIIEKKIYKLLD